MYHDVVNTRTIVSDIRQGVVDTRIIVSNIHREMLAVQEGTGSHHYSVSVVFTHQ